MKAKQVIVIRKDLNMRKGKIAAQAAHASLGVVLSMFKNEILQSTENGVMKVVKLCQEIEIGTALYEWLFGIFTKIVVYVNSEEEILDLAVKAHAKNIPYKVITDAGLTEFHGQNTITCIAIGPDWEDNVDEITGDLPLL